MSWFSSSSKGLSLIGLSPEENSVATDRHATMTCRTGDRKRSKRCREDRWWRAGQREPELEGLNCQPASPTPMLMPAWYASPTTPHRPGDTDDLSRPRTCPTRTRSLWTAGHQVVRSGVSASNDLG